jgi:hypothetical protein
VLKRQTPVHWSEAVAVVEELCAVVSATSGTPSIPDLADTLITADGEVIVRPGAGGDADVATLGRVLHALLASTTPPLPLRLFVTSSISSDRFKSVTLYAEALSYYGTPGRTEHIRALYNRAATATVAAAPVDTRALEAPHTDEKGAAPRDSRKRSTLGLYAAAIFSGVLSGTMVALWMLPAPSASASAALTSASRNAVTPPVKPHDDWQLGPVTVSESLKEKAKEKEKEKKPTAARHAAASKPSPSVPLTATAQPNRAPSAPPTLPASPGIPPAPTQPSRVPLSASSSEQRSVPVAPAAPAPVNAAPAQTLPADATVYSEQDRDVVPPVPPSTRPAPPPADSPTDSMVRNTYELVIDQTGHVVSAKLVGRPMRLPDMGDLQALKGWRFTPAMKNGQPVSYRYFLRTVNSPR